LIGIKRNQSQGEANVKPEVVVITHPEDKNLGRPPSHANLEPVWFESHDSPFGSDDPWTLYLVVTPRADDEALAYLAKRGKVSLEALRQYRDSLPPRPAPYSDIGIETVEIPLLKMAIA
jgi:hypothetical protein